MAVTVRLVNDHGTNAPHEDRAEETQERLGLFIRTNQNRRVGRSQPPIGRPPIGTTIEAGHDKSPASNVGQILLKTAFDLGSECARRDEVNRKSSVVAKGLQTGVQIVTTEQVSNEGTFRDGRLAGTSWRAEHEGLLGEQALDSDLLRSPNEAQRRSWFW